jgi:hypothetical protein
MEAWLDGMAAALDEEPLTDQEVGLALRLAREVAHRVERKAAPMAAYLAGVRSGRLAGRGMTRAEAFREVVAAVTPLLPAADGDVEDGVSRL